jgi:predicted nucleic acid-binding protein
VRLFLDANVLFTAAYSGEGRSAALCRLARHGRCTLLASPHTVEEARRNLTLKAPEAMPRFQQLIDLAQVVPEADLRLVAQAADLGLQPNDAPILAAAVACGADLLVTGDRTHFGHLFGTEIGRVTVVTPAEALARVTG